MNRDEFIYKLANDIEWGLHKSDESECPECGGTVYFYGHDENGDFEYGDGYWECSSCGFKVTEDDLSSVDTSDVSYLF